MGKIYYGMRRADDPDLAMSEFFAVTEPTDTQKDVIETCLEVWHFHFLYRVNFMPVCIMYFIIDR